MKDNVHQVDFGYHKRAFSRLFEMVEMQKENIRRDPDRFLRRYAEQLDGLLEPLLSAKEALCPPPTTQGIHEVPAPLKMLSVPEAEYNRLRACADIIERAEIG